MTLQATEDECAAGRTAPRVSLASMEAKIVKKHFVDGATAAGVSVDVNPNGKIVGLGLLTVCILEMQNGFIMIGKSAPASPENYDFDLGKKLAYEDAIRQLWPMEGYALRDQLAAVNAQHA